MEPTGGSSTRFDVNLEADSTASPLAANSRASRDGTPVKNSFGDFVLRPSVRTKLLTAFLVIEVLLVSVGMIGLLSLHEASQQANQLVALQHKIEAYRQVQHDTLRQLYGVSTALAFPNETTLASALRRINQFGYDLDRISFVAKTTLRYSTKCAKNMRVSLPWFHRSSISSATGKQLRPNRASLRSSGSRTSSND
jgi:hypothetical protein